MYKVLITGVSGYIGSMLARELLEAFHVIGVSKDVKNMKTFGGHLLVEPKFDYYEIDVRDTEKLRPIVAQADVVIPLAGLVGAPKCKNNPNYAYEVNQLAIEDLVRILGKNQRIVFPNTNSVYGLSDNPICTEESLIAPTSIYGKTKQAGEEAVLKHDNSCVFRLATVFGLSTRMRWDLMINDFLYRGIRDRKLDVFQPQFRRNFVHMLDVCKAFRKAVTHPMYGVYNLGNPETNYTKREIAQLIIKNLEENYNIKVEYIDGEGSDLDNRDYYVDNTKAIKAGIQFTHNLQYGINELVHYINNFQEFKDLL